MKSTEDHPLNVYTKFQLNLFVGTHYFTMEEENFVITEFHEI